MADRGGAGIVAQGLRKRFGAVQALAGVDLEVPRGTVLGLLGPNGAGKTTAVKILTTLLPPDEGRATVAGFDVLREADELRAAIGLAGQYAAVDEYLTGRENIDLVGRLYHLPTVELRRRTQDLLERFDLVHAADRPVKTYSGGMRRRLDLGASLVGRPQVLFLDEPTTGLDIRSRLDLWEVIRQLVAEGTTLLLTTQYLEEADVLADRIAVIDRGEVIAEGTPGELKTHVGGEVVEVVVRDRSRVRAACAAIVEVAGGATSQTTMNEAEGRVAVTVRGSASVVVDVVRRLDVERIEVADLSVHKPTLDDVFLALTGRVAEPAAGDGPAPEPVARGGGRSE
ncbi:MAG TPA: ATP-binding cassette domain-containing protein [Acidimicrobiales bacterium]|nr:ATP-binding cassette domain-containing protein [Acidimicrobiales bacterium]